MQKCNTLYIHKCTTPYMKRCNTLYMHINKHTPTHTSQDISANIFPYTISMQLTLNLTSLTYYSGVDTYRKRN